jgi:hypothetical protein
MRTADHAISPAVLQTRIACRNHSSGKFPSTGGASS